jgi:hypothetical protein
MRAEERAIATYLSLVPKAEPDEWDDVLDTSDIILEEALLQQLEDSGEVEVEFSRPSLPSLIDTADEWDDNPTREVQLRPQYESGLFRRFDADSTILDAAMFVTELKRRHAALHSRIRRLENVRFELAQHPAARAAWGTLSGRFVELGRLVTTLGALVRMAMERGTLELFVPSRPLAAYMRGAFDYAENIVGAIALLGQELAQRHPNWDAFYDRVCDARSWIVPELFEEVRADLALMALQIGEKPVAKVNAELRKAALAQNDVETILEDWLG